jgi:hypothetical protein
VRRDDGNKFPFISSLGEQSLVTNERKHVHFNDKAEQWISVDIIDGNDDEDRIESYAIDGDDDDSSPDDAFLMMKVLSEPKVLYRSNQSTPQRALVPKVAPNNPTIHSAEVPRRPSGAKRANNKTRWWEALSVSIARDI